MTKERKHIIIYIISTIVIGCLFFTKIVFLDRTSGSISNYFISEEMTRIELYHIVIIIIIAFSKNLFFSKSYQKLLFKIDGLLIGLSLLIIPFFWFNALGLILIIFSLVNIYPKLKN